MCRIGRGGGARRIWNRRGRGTGRRGSNEHQHGCGRMQSRAPPGRPPNQPRRQTEIQSAPGTSARGTWMRDGVKSSQGRHVDEGWGQVKPGYGVGRELCVSCAANQELASLKPTGAGHELGFVGGVSAWVEVTTSGEGCVGSRRAVTGWLGAVARLLRACRRGAVGRGLVWAWAAVSRL